MGEIQRGTVYSLNRGARKGEPKQQVSEAVFKEDFGLEGDIHAGQSETKQVSILAWERIKEKNFCLKKTGINLQPGDFAENITTAGLRLAGIKIGTKLSIGPVLLEVSQIGKNCHLHCDIFKKIGSCIMPREGVFARVVKGGTVRTGDKIEITEDD